jgi:hypothetical protein
MLSTMVFAHFNLILDSMHEVFQGQMDSMKARTKTTIVALDRSMIAMVRELREARKRPLSKSAEDAKRTAEADTASPTAGAKPPGEPLPSPVEIVPATIKPAATVSTSKPAKPAEPHAAHVVPLHAQDRPPVVPARHKPAPAVSPPPSEDDDGTLEAHVAAFQEALAAAAESLAEARALDDAKLTAATGD